MIKCNTKRLWTEKHVEILKKKYRVDGENIPELIACGHTNGSIKVKAIEPGLKLNNRKK